jgi:hypothetical protein
MVSSRETNVKGVWKLTAAHSGAPDNESKATRPGKAQVIIDICHADIWQGENHAKEA